MSVSAPAERSSLISRVQSASPTILEACWLTGLIVAPLLVNPFGTYQSSLYKVAFLRTLVGVMVAVWVVEAGVSLGFTGESWRQRLHVPPGFKSFLRTPLIIPALALGGFYVLSTLFSVSPSSSLWGAPSRIQGTYTMLAYLGFFLIVAWHVRTSDQINRIVWAIILTGSLVSLLGISEWLGWSPWLPEEAPEPSRIRATVGNPVMLGTYLVLTSALLLGKLTQFWASIRERLDREITLKLAGFSALLFVQLAALFLTQSRGAWLGFIAVIIVFSVALFIKNRRWRMLGLTGVLLVLGAVALIALSRPTSLLGSLSDAPYLSRLADAPVSRPVETRTAIWEATTGLIIDHPEVPSEGDPWNPIRPLVGYGLETLRLAFWSVYPTELRHLQLESSRIGRIDRAHNLVLDLQVTVGLLGLLAFVSLVSMFFLQGGRLLKGTRWRVDQPFVAVLLAAVAGYLVTQLVGVNDQGDQLVFWTLLTLLIAMNRRASKMEGADPSSQTLSGGREEPAIRVISGRLVGYVAVAVALSGVVFSVNVNGNLVLADMRTSDGIDHFNESRWLDAASAFEGALGSPPLQARNNWHLAVAYSFQSLEVTDEAVQERLLKLARALEPADGDYHFRAGLTYGHWALTLDPAKYEEATQAFAEAVAVSPHEVDIYNQWAGFEVRRQKSDKAIELLHSSLEVDPRWAPTYYQLSTVYRALGREEEAEAAFRRSVEVYSQEADLASRKGRYDKALELLHSSLKIDSRWAPTHYQLANVYRELGRVDEAVTAYRLSIELSPTMWPAYLDLARVLVSTANLGDARPYAERYVGALPEEWEGRLVLASVYQGLGMTTEAQEQAAIALSLAPASSRREIQQLIGER